MSGHSGCQIFHISDKNGSRVRKVSSNLKYNERLKRQMVKQDLFNSSKIKKPNVIRSGFDKDGLFYFDMEYINGISFFEYIEKNDIPSIKNKFEKILEYISENNEIGDNVSSNIKEKIKSLQLPDKYSFYKDYCLDYDWNKINKSYCHGDLTFENIIIFDENIYFIDFLDSFTDTKLIDYSKIYQELYSFWSFRNKPKKFNIKYVILDEMILLEEYQRQAALRLLILNLLRIIPYSKQKECDFVYGQMKYILEKNK